VVHYRERLTVPSRWWLLLVGLAASIWLVYHHVYGFRVSLPAAGVVVGLGVIGLFAYGRLRITVDDQTIRVGRAALPLSVMGDVAALTGDRARTARGADLHPHAYLVIRGYVGPVVRIDVRDPIDPTPYWLVSTRRPARLVAVLEATRRAAG
jgi:hypothetical protein